MACRSCASLLTPEADKVGGAPSVGVPCNAAMAPGHDAAPDSQGPRPRWAAGHDSGQEVRLKCIVCVRSRLAALLVGLAMVAAACGGGGDEGGDTSGGSGAVQQGGTLNYAADQEPTGFNNNTSKDNGTSVLEHRRSTCSRRPFHAQPDFTVKMNDDVPRLGRADQRGPADDRLQDQAGRRLVGRHPDQRRRLHLPLGEPERHHQGQRRRLAPPATTRSRASTGSDNGKTVTVVFKTPFADWKGLFTGHPARPLHGGAAGRLEHRPRQEAPRRSPRPAGSRSRTTPPARA